MTEIADRAVAQGNHKHGYQGAIIRGWDTASERVVARCIHTNHATTGEARSCVGSAWFQAHDVHNIRVVGGVQPPKAAP